MIIYIYIINCLNGFQLGDQKREDREKHREQIKCSSPTSFATIAAVTSAIHVFFGLPFFGLTIGIHSSNSIGIFS
mgnify:CR=1 FL=1